jgi:GntR family transcriptional repressor for pyruvate dehydrogenase complex
MKRETSPLEFKSVKVPKLSDSIVDQLEQMILDGVLKPGDRLPPERELAQQLSVSRPSLREAIVIMESKGLLQARRGGGTFVCDVVAHTITDPLVHLLKRHPDATNDVVELRLSLEEIAAYYAALRATDADRTILRHRFEALEGARKTSDTEQNAEADVEFHMAIAEASHNVVLVLVMRGLFNMLRVSILDNLEKIYREASGQEIIAGQHRDLFDAVISGEAEAAREAAHTHLAFVAATLREGFEETTREKRSRRRLRSLEE